MSIPRNLACALAFLVSISCTRTVTRTEYLPAPPCRTRDAPRPAEGVLPPSGEWFDWVSLELLPWIVEVERSCPKD